MPARKTCTHGVTPKHKCKLCTNETSRISARKNYNAEKNREKYLADRGKQLVSSMNNRAKRLGIPGTLTVQFWFQLVNSPCVYCGSTKYIEMDHRVSFGKGGTNYPENVQPCCRYCNRSKNWYGEDEFIEWLNWLRQAS